MVQTVIVDGPLRRGQLRTNQSNNSALQSVTISSGDNILSATTSYTYTPLGDVDTIDGPSTGNGDSQRLLYDLALRRVKGRIAPDPDGSDAGKPMAARFVYDNAGRLQRTETGVVDGSADSQWSSFQPSAAQENVYDSYGRIVQARVSGNGTVAGLTETSYDSAGRTDCVAVRMNAGALTGAPSSACTANAPGTEGADRITRNVYHVADRRIEVTSGYGTPEALTQTMHYTASGQQDWVRDGEGNRTTYTYDGHDRLKRTSYPIGTRGADSSSGSDFEELGYDIVGNVDTRRLRDGRSLGFTYDALNRVTRKTVPDGCAQIQIGTCAPASATRDVDYVYDLAGRLTSATFSTSSEAVSASYDALGRMTNTTTTMGGVSRTLTYQHDVAGNRTSITHPDSVAFNYVYDDLNRPTAIRNGANANISIMAYYDAGQRRWIGHNANGTGYGYDPLGRLTGYNHQRNQAGTIVGDNTSLTYNPASQITQQIRSSDAYAWTGAVNADRAYTSNGLNQYTAAGAAAFQYDANGNLVASGATGYLYDAENRLIGSSTGVTLTYDPLGRLFQTATNGSGVTQFLYDGDALVAEYDGAGTLLNRYVHADRVDEPVLWYQGSSTTPRQLMADHQGSIVAVTQHGWSLVGVNTYDEYGIPGAANIGRFQYTGQAWIPELGMYHYKARMYSPTLGRFLQTDPVGYADGLNVYNYVGADPANRSDPTGKCMKFYWDGHESVELRESYAGACNPEGGDGGGIPSWWSQPYDNTGPAWPGGGGGWFGGLIGGGAGATGLGNAGGGSPQNEPICTTGSRITVGRGISATGFLGLGGLTGGAEFGLAIPSNFLETGSLRGTQVYLTSGAALLAGIGGFFGAGQALSIGESTGLLPTGLGMQNFSSQNIVQGGIGWGPGGEISAPVNAMSFDGGFTAAGATAGYGYGLYGAGGKKFSFTTASDPFGC